MPAPRRGRRRTGRASAPAPLPSPALPPACRGLRPARAGARRKRCLPRPVAPSAPPPRPHPPGAPASTPSPRASAGCARRSVPPACSTSCARFWPAGAETTTTRPRQFYDSLDGDATRRYAAAVRALSLALILAFFACNTADPNDPQSAISQLGDSDAKVRIQAVQKLRKLKAKQAAPQIATLLKDPLLKEDAALALQDL